ncbi:MAG: 50S ribosomal protein L11 methyltransferase [Deltaproteobacteria bacterium]|nr:50S ribosomal protein L11 methyltransferase [Deltaproteobacteria bacterium]
MTRALRARHVRLDDDTGVIVYEAKDPGQAVDVAIAARAPAPYGAVLWDSAVDVAKLLLTWDLRGRRVLDLGCGCGLTVIAAALRGAHVHATDVDDEVLVAVNRAALEQGLAGLISTGPFNVCGGDPLPAADDVVIADLLYEPLLAAAVARRALEAFKRGSRVVVGDPDRAGRQDFIKLVQAGVQSSVDVAFAGNVLVLDALAALDTAGPKVGAG